MKHLALLVVFSLIAAVPSAAQGLADIARKEEARRKAVKVPGKVYTNGDLKPDPSKGSTERPADLAVVPPTGRKAGSQVGTEANAKAVAGQSGAESGQPPAGEGEVHWKGLMAGARAALERSKVLADALQSRLNALATDIVNRDDPAQRAQLELERQRAITELDRMKAEIAEQTKAIADLEEDARKAGVPPGWLR